MRSRKLWSVLGFIDNVSAMIPPKPLRMRIVLRSMPTKPNKLRTKLGNNKRQQLSQTTMREILLLPML